MRKLFELNRELADLQERKSKLAVESEGKEVKEERLAQINTELDGINVKIKELEEERNKAEAEEKRLRDSAKETELRVNNGRMTSEANEIEQRVKQLIEKRAITISSGTLVTPKKTATEINDNFNEISSILTLVGSEDNRGMGEYEEPYLISTGTGGETSEGEGANTAEPTFGYATIKPVKCTAYAEVSEETTKLTPVAYLNKVQSAALTALRKKVQAWIVSGNAALNPTFIGINTASATALTGSDVEINAIGPDTLRDIVLAYGGDENIVGSGVLFLNKLDLAAFGKVRGTNEKKALYEIIPDLSNPNTGIIKEGGTSVRYCINSNIPALSAATTEDDTYCMFYGIPLSYKLGLFSDYEVKVSTESKFKEGMLAVKGMVMIGGNVTVHKGFVRVKK